MISALAVGALTLGACGGDDGGDGSGGGSDTVPAGALEVRAIDIAFDAEEYSAAAGDVTIAYVSEGQQQHTLVVFDEGNEKIGERLAVGPGDTDAGVFPLAAGSYTLICDVPGHQEAGMVATLDVG
jgi:plastocyanin